MSDPLEPGFDVEVVEFDFERRDCGALEVQGIQRKLTQGRFLWIDLNVRDPNAARSFLTERRLLSEQVLDEVFVREAGTQLMRHDSCLHLVLADCRLAPNGALVTDRMDVVVAAGFMVTVHEGTRPFLQAVKRDYRDDFQRFAKTPSFLVYELWDHLLDQYVSIQEKLEHKAQLLQRALFSVVDDRVFVQVAEIGAALLEFRSMLMPARAVLTELSTRRSAFISEATQGFLGNMVGIVERLLQDVLVDRDGLNQSLNLTMSMNSHRTNQAMTKLTVLSTIFLPLTFLCGVYGMNFEILPELRWRFGYVFFWILCFVIVGLALYLVRRNRML